MLTENHPHAWKPEHANEHLDPDFRRTYMPPGSRLVVTPDMTRLIGGMPTALDRCTATVVSGPWGSGKSTLLQSLAAVSDVNTVLVEIPESAGATRAQWDVLTTAITGSATGTAHQLQHAARDYLAAVPTLLIVDEAQHLSHAALRQLRWLWTSRLPRFAIVLAGSNLNAHLDKEPSLATRVNQRILLRTHSTELMVKRLQASHPDLAATRPQLLELIDQAYGNGVWRNHSEMLLKAALELGHTGPLTHEVAEEVIYDRTGAPLALTPAGARTSALKKAGR
ncbi:AAA family ATPase [Nocardioides sp. T5]|uniref:AAA family ATPase n=1 Tax=Nocardioides sp. T5 TaxID=3400182 RepID=UPI003A8B219B